MVAVMKIMVTSFKRSYACTAVLSNPQPCNRPLWTHSSSRDSWTLTGKSGSVFCGVTAPFSWVLLCTRSYLCPPRVYSPVLYKSLQLCSGVDGDLLQVDLCHTNTQSPCPCSRPPLTCTSTGTLKHSLYQSLWGHWVLVRTRFV